LRESKTVEQRTKSAIKTMKIQVLGSGCEKCNRLAETVVSLARELQIKHSFEKVSDISQIIATGVISTPALVIDGEVLFSGQVPSNEEIKKLLQQPSVSCFI